VSRKTGGDATCNCGLVYRLDSTGHFSVPHRLWEAVAGRFRTEAYSTSVGDAFTGKPIRAE